MNARLFARRLHPARESHGAVSGPAGGGRPDEGQFAVAPIPQVLRAHFTNGHLIIRDQIAVGRAAAQIKTIGIFNLRKSAS